jgi:hypothetical protein
MGGDYPKGALALSGLHVGALGWWGSHRGGPTRVGVALAGLCVCVC